MRSRRTGYLRARRLAVTALATLAAAPAFAATGPAPDIVVRDNLDPDASGAGGLDPVDINGIGQMTVDQGGGYVGLCTGTLINPRTVIFAAHCVNEAPAQDYGAKGGGIPISFGFHSDNLPAILDWLGAGDDPVPYRTNIGDALYNVEQVWYDKRSTALGPNLNFLQADVAIATLDTPARNIPTWTLLFSPLSGPAHATVTGYGDYGNGTVGQVDLDFRRRAAENMVSVLASLDDVDGVLFGQPDGLPQTLYQTDFNDPKYGTAGANQFDFDIFGDKALKREGTTAPGDSGGPLIIDTKFDKPVVAGVLDGGSTYFADQPSASYGSTSFYQPLFLFWEEIVQNNPYRYAGNKAGVGDWMDPKHWVQLMDPAYAVIRGGKLVNALPGSHQQGVSGATVKFGKVCDGETCTAITSDGPAPSPGSGAGLVIPGGPGSTDFVPNNVVADPAKGIRSRYFDVTLSALGITRLNQSVTIDRLTVDGPTILDVKSHGRLNVLTDYTQGRGWTNIDGTLKAGESLLIDGLLTGSGVFDPTYFTSIRGTIAPGGLGSVGTLTVKGDVILSSASTLYVDLTRSGADTLAVRADADNPGELAVGGRALFGLGFGPLPRFGQTFTIATAQGGIAGTFDHVTSLLPGVLRAVLDYEPNAIDATIKAGSLFDLLKGSGSADTSALKFAAALDQLRGQNYAKLGNVYGSIDVQDGARLAQSLRSLAPATTNVARVAQDRQRITGVNLVADRLSDLGGSHGAAGLSLIGSPAALMRVAANAPAHGIAERPAFLALGLAQAPQTIAKLPDGMSGFVASSVSVDGGTALSGGDAGGRRQSWTIAMGLEDEVGARTIVGFASGVGGGATGVRRAGDSTGDDSQQIAFYGTRRLGGGGYVGGVVSALFSNGRTERQLSLGDAGFDLRGAPAMRSYTLAGEGGVNIALGRAMTLTPRIGLRYALTRSGGYRESGGDAALQVDARSYGEGEARIGAKLAGSRPIGGGWSFRPNLQLDWVRNLTGGDAGVRARFAQAADYAIDLPGEARSRMWGELRGGVQLTDGRLSLGLAANGSTGGQRFGDNSALATVGLAF